MASLFSLLSVARDGVLAQTAALDVTTQNVAGANTAGYVRRAPVLESVASGGVTMAGVSRSFDRFTFGQLVDQEGRLASASARSGALADLEALVSPAADHLGERADALFASFQELALRPTETSARSAVLANAEWLAAGFSETADGLERSRAELFTRARDVASEVNLRLDSLAEIDMSVVETRARGEDVSPLLDRRDQLVRDIAERVGARVVEDDAGRLTLFAAGTVLYQGGVAAKLSVSQDPAGSLRVQADRSGNVIDVTARLDTGTLAGIQEVRDVDIPGVLGRIDAYAKDIADAVNALHASGVALDGTSGRPLFTPHATVAGAAHAMAVDPSLVGRPDLVAAADAAGELPAGNVTAVALANLARSALPGGGTASERYAAIASTVGVLRTTSIANEQMREDTVATATTLRESVSGVSTDEEMVRLQQFQRSFEACTRVLRTIDELFDSLLQAV